MKNKWWSCGGLGKQDSRCDFVKWLIKNGVTDLKYIANKEVFFNTDEETKFEPCFIEGDFTESPGMGYESPDKDYEYYFQFD